MRANVGAVVECWELLHEAVLELATRCATPRQRLLGIAEQQLLAVAELGPDLPDAELKAWIARLSKSLYARANRPSRVAAFSTVNAMSDEDVDCTLLDVVALYDEVTRCELIERLRTAA
jgi:hypothetical protein